MPRVRRVPMIISGQDLDQIASIKMIISSEDLDHYQWTHNQDPMVNNEMVILGFEGFPHQFRIPIWPPARFSKAKIVLSFW